jgi:hypothetical protein
MRARTYSTDVYLTCSCPDCEDRVVRITLRKFRSLTAPLASLRANRAPVGVRTRQPEIARSYQVVPQLIGKYQPEARCQ